MNNRNIESTVRSFFKEFFPRHEQENVDSIVQEVIAKEYTKRQVLEYLYKLKIESRFITLEPGDILSFGTTGKGRGRFPRGHKSVLMGETRGTIGISIDPLGRLENPIEHFKQ